MVKVRAPALPRSFFPGTWDGKHICEMIYRRGEGTSGVHRSQMGCLLMAKAGHRYGTNRPMAWTGVEV